MPSEATAGLSIMLVYVATAAHGPSVPPAVQVGVAVATTGVLVGVGDAHAPPVVPLSRYTWSGAATSIPHVTPRAPQFVHAVPNPPPGLRRGANIFRIAVGSARFQKDERTATALR